MEGRSTGSAENKNEVIELPLPTPEFNQQSKRILDIYEKAKEDAIRRIREGNTGKVIIGNAEDSIARLNSVIAIVSNRSNKALAVTYSHRKPPEIEFFVMKVYKLTDNDIYEISLHELAHVLTPNERHNTVWKYTYEGIGGNRPLSRFFIPAGKHYHYHIPVGVSAMTGRIRYRNYIGDEVFKQKHPDLDQYITEVTESS